MFYLYPFLATFYYSFTSFTGIGNPVFTGLANYSGLLHDSMFRTAVFNTVYYTAIEVPFSTVVALGLALLLNMNVRGQAIYRTLFYIPSIVPVVASSLIFVWIFQPSFGIVNDAAVRRARQRPRLVLLDHLVQADVHPARPVGARAADGDLPGGAAGSAQGDVRGGRRWKAPARGSGCAT